MIANLSLCHIEGVTRAYGRQIPLAEEKGRIEWMLVMPKDHVLTPVEAGAIAGTLTESLVAASQFVPPPAAEEITEAEFVKETGAPVPALRRVK